jgi:hypothetical protein
MALIEFRAINFPDRFIRHRNFLGELTTKDRLANDFQFQLVKRGKGLVALRSKNFPNLFLRHRDFRVRLEGPNGQNDQLFLRDSTFALVAGLADPSAFSLRSFNFPDRFLRHRNFSLFVEPRDSPSFALDATFLKLPAPVIFDEA